MPLKTSTEIVVRNYHIDHFGHVNHARFVEILEEARWRYLEYNTLLGSIHKAGAVHIVAELHIRYHIPASIGDILFIETEISGRSYHSFLVSQRICINSSKKIAVDARITNVFVTKLGRPRKIDEEILQFWPDLANAALL